MNALFGKILFIASTLILCSEWVRAQSVQETVNTAYSPWAVTAFSLVNSEADQANRGGGLFSYNYIGPNYRINERERIALKAAFTASTAGYSRFNGECNMDQEAAFDDPFLEYANFNLGLLPGVADIFWSGRVYLPVSEASRQQKRIGRYDSNLIINRWVTRRVSVEARNDTTFYHQSQTTFRGQFMNDQCQLEDAQNPSNTRLYRMENWLSVWYVASRQWSFGLSAMVRDQGYNPSEAFETGRQREGRMRELTAFLGPSVRWNVHANLNFLFSVRDRVDFSGFHPDRQGSLTDLGQFRAKNTEISLLSFIRF